MKVCANSRRLGGIFDMSNFDSTATRPLPRMKAEQPAPAAPAAKTETNAVFRPDMIYADSHRGLVRHGNQDSFAYTVRDEGNLVFMLVADGIGGNEGGDLASRFVSEMLLRDFQAYRQDPDQNPDKQMIAFLKKCLILANSALKNLNRNYNIAHPMGTTVAVLVLTPEKAYTAHAGDSRVYRLRKGELKHLTQDHSIVAELVRSGKLTEEEAKSHPMAHVISQSIGVRTDIKPDFSVYDHQPGDRYMICSDGVLLHLADPGIHQVLAAAKNARDAVRNLITLGLRGGGGDNITSLCAFTE